MFDTQERTLCYEIHGEAGKYFNLISDMCVSVNTHYAARGDGLNILDKIGVRAVDTTGTCVNVSVILQNNATCRAMVNGVPRLNYRRGGVVVRSMGSNAVSISVPNCQDTMLDMTVA